MPAKATETFCGAFSVYGRGHAMCAACLPACVPACTSFVDLENIIFTLIKFPSLELYKNSVREVTFLQLNIQFKRALLLKHISFKLLYYFESLLNVNSEAFRSLINR